MVQIDQIAHLLEKNKEETPLTKKGGKNSFDTKKPNQHLNNTAAIADEHS